MKHMKYTEESPVRLASTSPTNREHWGKPVKILKVMNFRYYVNIKNSDIVGEVLENQLELDTNRNGANA